MQNKVFKFLTPEQKLKVEEAVAREEQHTSGEIVPVIVSRSIYTGHVPMILLLIGYLILLGVHTLFPWPHPAEIWIYLGLSIALWPLVYFLARLQFLQRLLTSSDDREFEVLERAELEFYRNRLSGTQARTGVLIFISLLEQRCVVLADEGIAKQLPKETWSEIVSDVVQWIRQGDPTQGLLTAVQKCGALLAKHFPSKDDNPNELPNKLIIKL